MSRLRRALIGAGGALGALVLGLGLVLAVLHRPLPEATPGPEAEALAARMIAAVDGDAWRSTGAVAWTFAGHNQHLWDRTRNLARVQWGQTTVLLDLDRQDGVVTIDGQPAQGRRARRRIQDAYARWVNDSFWLNPAVKALDEGTERALVDLGGGRQGLLVTYTSGGLTPGDSYLWLLDASYRPVAWRLWVSVLPIGGIETSWEGWQKLSTGAWIATQHRGMLGLAPQVTSLRAASNLRALLGTDADPFAPLLAPTPTAP